MDESSSSSSLPLLEYNEQGTGSELTNSQDQVQPLVKASITQVRVREEHAQVSQHQHAKSDWNEWLAWNQ